MNLPIHIVFSIVIIFPLFSFANNIECSGDAPPREQLEDITKLPTNCDPITEEQIKHLEDSLNDSEIKIDPWVDGDVVDIPEEDLDDKPSDGGDKGNGKFFGGVGSLFVANDLLIGEPFYTKSRLNIRKERKKRTSRKRIQKFIDEQNEKILKNGEFGNLSSDLPAEDILGMSNSIYALKIFLSSNTAISYDVLTEIRRGDWKDSLIIKDVTPIAFITGSAILLYRMIRFINIPGYLFLTASAGAYADLDTEYKDYPERILEVDSKEKLEWLLTIDEIRVNALSILKYTKDRLCENYPKEMKREMDIENVEGPQKNYCESVRLVLE